LQFIIQDAVLCTRVIYFSGGKSTVGMTAGLQKEFLAQKFPLNSFKNNGMGALLILTLAVYYSG
jgi:hypothetical protein